MKLALIAFILVIPKCSVADTGATNYANQRQAREVPDVQSQDGGVTIPLDQVWAYEMPGTRDIRKLNPSDKDLVELIQQSLGRKTSDDKSKPGFVVQGEDRDVLQEAYDVLVSRRPAEKKVKGNSKIWVVFFSRDSSHYVHLQEAQRKVNQISVRYHFVPHDSKELTRHVALIPLGNLPTGKYRVSLVNSPMERRYLALGYRPIPESYIPKIICSSFEFVITENP